MLGVGFVGMMLARHRPATFEAAPKTAPAGGAPAGAEPPDSEYPQAAPGSQVLNGAGLSDAKPQRQALGTPPGTNAAVRQIKPQITPAVKPEEAIKDPTARAALSWVGVDAVAEAYWIDAINDPSLSADERQNLIEDLNEDGLSDPQHPGEEDMPVIAYRILLIEELAPLALDQVNADAFQEAYKDLTNLLAGRPAD